jgi:ATP-dependent Clp protease ATP-binding subunit ClpC
MTDSMNNFTPRAQQMLALAQKEAHRFRHNYIGTEHVILGLLKLGQGVGGGALQRKGVDLEELRTRVEKMVSEGLVTHPQSSLPHTPRVKKVFAMARKEAKLLHHCYVGTEHILIGLLREGEGVAALALKSFGMTADIIRLEIRRELGLDSRPDPVAEALLKKQ